VNTRIFTNHLWTMLSKRKKGVSSQVHDYFDVIKMEDGNWGTAHCKVGNCRHEVTMSNSSTSNLWTHLRTKHAITAADSSVSPPETLFNKVRNTNSQPASKKSKDKHFDEAFFRMVVRDLRPLSIGEGAGMRAFCQSIHNYVPNGHQTLQRHLICEHDAVCDILKDQLKNEMVSLTFDGWSSRAMDSYLGVTAHYLDENFVPHKEIVSCEELSDSHTAAHLASTIENLVESWGIPNICGITTDNAKNVVNCCEILEENIHSCHMRCAAHTLQLCVTDVVRYCNMFILIMFCSWP